MDRPALRVGLAPLALCLVLAAPAAAEEPSGWPAALEEAVARERADKELPAFAVVVVDRETTLAEVARGARLPGGDEPVTGETLFRTGSVGKTLTDLALLVAMDEGRLALEDDVRRFLPDFAPANPFGAPITLLHLMTHQAGLVREPPVGSYFDASGASLVETVASLGGTSLLWEPGTRTKYSNAGLAVAGRVLEVAYGKTYGEVIEEVVYRPAGMATARVGLGDDVLPRLARGVMWQPDGRQWSAPLFDLGMAPAGDLYASLRDMAAFIRALLGGRLVRPATFDRMWRPRYDPPRSEWHLEVGLGFSLNGKFLGRHKLARNGGAVYGYATELALLPEEGLGVYAVATRDLANGAVRAVAHWALAAALAERRGEPVPSYELAAKPFGSLPDKLAACTLEPGDGGFDRYLGRYGPDHNPLTLCVLEGELHALVEWFFLYPLEESAEGVFRFPSWSLYSHEELRLVEGPGGGMTAVLGHGAEGVRFERR